MEPEQGNSAPQPEKEEASLQPGNDSTWRNQAELGVEEDTEANTGETAQNIDNQEPSTPAASAISDTAAPIVPPVIPEPSKKRSRKKLLIVVAAIVVVLGLGGGAAAYYLLGNKPAAKHNNQTPPPTNPLTQTEPTTPTTTDKSIAQIIAALKDNYKVVDQKQSPANGEIQIVTSKFSPALRQSGTTYFIAPAKGTSVTVNFAKGDTKTINSVNAFMDAQRQELTLKASGDQSDLSDTPTGILYQNSTNTYVCDFPASGTDPSSAYPLYSFVCDDRASYTAALSDMLPLVEAYKAAGNSTDDTLFSSLVIEPSVTTGYSRGQLGIGSAQGVGGFEGLFYEKGTTWHYWIGTQEGISCSDAGKDPDVAAAYKGEQCITSDGQQSTVQ